jgi:hypothetical protein
MFTFAFSSSEVAIGGGSSKGELSLASLWSDAASCAIERRMGRRGLACRSDWYLFADNRLRFHSFPNELPKAKNLLRGKPVGSEFRNPKPGAKSILMVIALYNIRERQHSGRVQRCGGLAKPIAAGWCLIEDERKWFAKFANGAKCRQRCLDVGRTWPRWDQAHIGYADGA